MSQNILGSKPLSYLCDVEKLCQHIERLLVQHDYVVVPNLGGFVVQMQSATLLSDRIAPPFATIGFNPLMLHTDGLLALEVAKSEHISYRKAVEFIDYEVENISFKLKSNGNVVIGNLGVMYLNSLGNIIFSPIYKANFLPQNFGLSDLYVSTKIKNSIREKRKITLTLPSNRTFKYVAAAMLIFGLFFVTPRVSDVRQADYANIADIAFVNSPKILVKRQVAIELKKVEPSEILTKVVINHYHVIVASLANQKTAEKFCNDLITDKFPNAHLISPSKLYRVSIQSFSDRNKAIQFMENLRQTDIRFETAWVLCK